MRQNETVLGEGQDLPIIVNGTLSAKTKKRYRCTFTGCDKAYTKPSRLEEHERSHTGDRPFVCSTCNKSYLRDSHLQVHIRSHLPQSSRPFICAEEGCTKRFMTAHHLRRHQALHSGERPFKCSEPNCQEMFTKHHQLREHICSIHSPPGTKSYICYHAGCSKSFSTNQHLRAHSKVHDDKRYTCIRPECLPASANVSPVYFSTWSALQHHNRTIHPPRCDHESCNGKTFSSHHNLRVHQKLHDQRDAEAAVESDTEEDGDLERPRKKQRGGEYGRDWKCEADGCEKDFKSKNALTTHVNVTHLGIRNHICSYEGCGCTFGYKHLLQRHMTKAHRESTSGRASRDDDSDSTVPARDETQEHGNTVRMDIDTITGHAYAVSAQIRVQMAKALRCPYPDLAELSVDVQSASTSRQCEYVFTRAYDLRRHLRAKHALDVEKDMVEIWVNIHRS